jgi:mannose-6-phosphate isomerase-like protein (cupin superfamily)
MRALVVTFIVTTAALSLESAPAGFNLWRSSELHTLENKLSRELDSQKVASQRLGTYGNHTMGIARREGTGNAEFHEAQNDIFIVQSGEATLIEGGTLVDPRTTELHEVEGTSITGGNKRKLAAGDIVHIPFKTPHQLIVDSGKQITYFVVKIDAQ